MKLLVLLVLFALSVTPATAKDVSKLNLDSTRDALFVYDTMLVKQDREQMESLISGMQIGML